MSIQVELQSLPKNILGKLYGFRKKQYFYDKFNSTMKTLRFISIAIILLIIAPQLRADQLQWISKDQADAVLQYFKMAKIKQGILWCACCDNDPKVKIKIKKVEMRYTGTGDYYEIVLTGKLSTGEKFSGAIDLAYFHIKSENMAYALGYVMQFDCDPCTGPFAWSEVK